tara:strand:- start:42 stop:311 length:270 start_codon:yes stop_codon:yes gene_type:complete
MAKISPKIKFLVGGVLLLGVFVFFMKQTASVFQPRSRGNQKKIGFLGGSRRGRSNRGGTGLRRGRYRNLGGNQTQRNLQRSGTRLMRRS